MTTLTDFLLARISEDEEVAIEAVRVAEDAAPGVEWTHLQLNEVGGNSMHDEVTVGAHRFLAECEAKRRIVELHSGGAEWCGWTQGGDGTHDDMGNGPADCDTARALAQVYADHPDFDESWSISE